MSDTELLDVAGLKRQVMGDAEFLAEQLELFREYYPNQLGQIRDGIESGDASQVCEWAHQLSGSLSNFHAIVARATAKSIEACGRDKQLAEASTLHTQLEQQVVDLCETVEGICSSF